MSAPQVARFRPVLEVLEDRLALSRFPFPTAQGNGPLRFEPAASQSAFRFPQGGLAGTGEEATGSLAEGLPDTGLLATGLTGAGLPGTGLQATGLTGAGLPRTGVTGTGFGSLPAANFGSAFAPSVGTVPPGVPTLTPPFVVGPFGVGIAGDSFPATQPAVSGNTPRTATAGIPRTGIQATGLSGAGLPGTGMVNTGLSGSGFSGSGTPGGTSAANGQRPSGNSADGFWAALAASGLPT